MSTAELYQPLDHSPPLFRRSASANHDGVTVLSWWTMFVCSVIALATSSYLAWSSLTSSPVAGCGGGSTFDCSHVLHSQWSSVLSIPVSIPAIATHALIVGLLLTQPITKRMQNVRWNAIGLASLAAGAAAIWFVGLQLFALGHLCPYCLVAHAAGLVLAGLFLWNMPVKKQAMKWIAGGTAASIATLISLQLVAEPPNNFEVIEHTETPAAVAPTNATESDAELFTPPESADLQASLKDRGVSFQLANKIERQARSLPHLFAAIVNPATLMYGQVTAAEPSDDKKANTAKVLNGVELATTDWPLIGKPDAELVFVEMFDYTCPHCQRTHQSLDAARKQLGDRLAVITLPVPLDGKCNPTVKSTHASHSESCEIAKLAVAVWTVDKSKFTEFHDYLFEAKPSYAAAMAKATTIVENDKLDEALQSPVPSDYIKKHIALYQRAGAGAIPKLLFPKTTVVGAVESPQAMANLIQQNLESKLHQRLTR